MFALCESMKWSHLPVAGGIYEQSPELIEGFKVIFAERAKYEFAEHKKRERQLNSNRGRVAGRRR